MRMRVALWILCCVLEVCSLRAQKMPSDYFEEAEQFADSNNYTKSAELFQYIVAHFPKSKLYANPFYNTGYCLFMDKRYDGAAGFFKRILNSNFNEYEKTGGDIMDDPYANYRHRACEILTEIYVTKEKYDTALYYFSLADTAYPYLHFCGNEYAENDVYKALKYAGLYTKLDKRDKAIEMLLPAVFVELADNTAVIKELKRLLKRRKGLEDELDRAMGAMYPKVIKGGEKSYTYYYFRFLNAEIAVPDSYEDDETKFDRRESVKKIKESAFYRMIKTL